MMTNAEDYITLLGFMMEIALGMNDHNEKWLAEEFNLSMFSFEILIRLKLSPLPRLRPS